MSRAMFNLKPCPFCGSREVHVEISCQGKEGEALRGTTWPAKNVKAAAVLLRNEKMH